LPCDIDVIAGLQNGPQLARAPAMDEAEMPAVPAREQLEHRARLGMRPHAQDHALVAPVHARIVYESPAIVAPAACRLRFGNHGCNPHLPRKPNRSIWSYTFSMFRRTAMAADLPPSARARAPQLSGDYAFHRFCTPHLSRYRQPDHEVLAQRARHHLRRAA